MQKVESFIETNKKRFVDELAKVIRIPSVSAQLAHKGDMQHCAEAFANEFRQIGLSQVEVIPTAGNPVVYGEWCNAPGKPTVLIYGHYDVQPEDPLDEWDSPPFDVTVKNGAMYGRGTADDKGQLWIHLKAVEYYLREVGKLPVNVKFLVEGEEEIGSAHLNAFIQENRQKLTCDTVMISDTEMVGLEIPSLTYSLRGLVSFEVEVSGANRDVHSGTKGGAHANPIMVLAQIIAEMKDINGIITVPGFFDDVRELTSEERQLMKKVPFNDEEFRHDLAVGKLIGDTRYSVLERLTTRPTLDVVGIFGGYTGDGIKNIVPAKVRAKFNARMVPNQDPQRIMKLIREFMLQHCPSGVRLQFFEDQAEPANISPIDGPAVMAARRALKRSFGKEALLSGSGGAIPVVGTFKKLLEVSTVMMGIGTPDENIHSPNEKLYLSHFYKGIAAAIYFLEEFAKGD